MPDKTHTFPARYRTELLVVLFLAALTAILFGRSVYYDLVDLDDLMYITQNQNVLNGLSWSSTRLAFTQVWQGMWAPLLWVSYMLDVELFGMNAWGFHFTNCLLHVFNAGLVFALFWGWSRKPWRALWAAAFWAWHPLRVESVAWVSERKDVLSGFFFLLCAGTYFLAWRSSVADAPSVSANPLRRRLLLGTSAAMLALGLMVKPMLVTTPFLLLLLDFWPLGRFQFVARDLLHKLPRLIAEKWAFWAVSAAAAFMAMHAHAAVGAVQKMPWLGRLMIVPLHYVFYLFKTIRPHNLTVLYEEIIFTRADFLIAVLLLGGLSAWIWMDSKRQGNALVGWAWFLGLFVPVIGFVRFGAQSIADRFTYLPAIGLSLLLLQMLRGKKTAAFRTGRALLCGGLLLGMAALTHQQLPVWRNSATLYDNVLHYFPASSFGLYYQAMQLIKQGSPEKAEAKIDLILVKSPNVEINHYGKVLAMAAQGKAAEAMAWLASRPPPAHSSSPGYWDSHMGMLALQLQDYGEALVHARDALRKLPVHDISRHEVLLLGMTACFEQGDESGALWWARQWGPYQSKGQIELLDLMPYYLKQWDAGQRAGAMDYFRRLLAARSNDVEWLNNLAWLLATATWGPADPQEILEYAKNAVEQGGDHPVLLDTLGVAFANAGDFASARKCAEKALTRMRLSGQADPDLHRKIAERLQYYENGNPWREPEAVWRLMTSFHVR